MFWHMFRRLVPSRYPPSPLNWRAITRDNDSYFLWTIPNTTRLQRTTRLLVQAFTLAPLPLPLQQIIPIYPLLLETIARLGFLKGLKKAIASRLDPQEGAAHAVLL
jgi:hypothetical protein